jgi:RHS repeat-associated protein
MSRERDKHRSSLRTSARRAGALLVLACGPLAGPAWAQHFEPMEFYHYDALGSVRLVVSFPHDSGTYTISRHDYLPFGEEIQVGTFGRARNLGYGNGDTTPQRFTAKERDPESNLDYFGARYYSGAQGRFTSADRPFADQHPVDPRSWNLYAYVRNNPLRNVDPDGTACFDHTGAQGCWQYTIGIAKEIGNIPNNTLNLVVDVENLAISPLTDGRFQKLPTYQAANEDQAEGMKALRVGLVVTGALELGASMLGEAGAAGTTEASLIQGRASEVHGALDPIAREMRTTAVGETVAADGSSSTLVGSSRPVLSPAQRAVLKPGEVPVRGPGHAETTVLNAARQAGRKVPRMDVSRKPCPLCAEELRQEGTQVTYPH